jgi:hypothetical protein
MADEHGLQRRDERRAGVRCLRQCGWDYRRRLPERPISQPVYSDQLGGGSAAIDQLTAHTKGAEEDHSGNLKEPALGRLKTAYGRGKELPPHYAARS